MMRGGVFRRAACVGGVALAAILALATPAYPARTEVPLATPPGPYGDVARSMVSLDAPLPANTPAHPRTCDELRYLRFRPASGAADPTQADAVFVAMPGTLGGAGSLEVHGLNVVQQAADRGMRVEVWALDRRANCLEDRHGLDAALRAGDPGVALDYYFARASVEGRTFGGFLTSRQLAVAAAFDLRQTVEDYRTVIVEGFPDPAVRARKVFCGGHSLGGSVTGQLMAWDFDGRSATTGDAGYKLCRGTIALDSSVTADPSGLGSTPLAGPTITRARSLSYEVAAALIDRALPVADFGFVGPETVGALSAVALAARLQPTADARPFIARLPRGGNLDAGLRLFHSQTLGDAIARVARIRKQHLTSEALLGALLDDDTQPLAFIRASVGLYDRGPFAIKRFGASGPTRLLFPASDDQRYGWTNYNGVLPVGLGPSGFPLTSPADEVTDVQALARIFSSGPLDFAEQYFPTRLTVDVTFSQAGARGGDLARVRYLDGPAARPRLTVFAQNGVTNKVPPPVRAGDRVIVLPGYDHVDVVTAAAAQNDGQPEGVAKAVVDFLDVHTGRGETASVAPRSGAATRLTIAARLRTVTPATCVRPGYCP